MLNDLQLTHIAHITFEADRAYWNNLGIVILGAWHEVPQHSRKEWLAQVKLCADSKAQTVAEYHMEALDALDHNADFGGPYFIDYALTEGDALSRTKFDDLPEVVKNSITLLCATIKTYVLLTVGTVSDPSEVQHLQYECHGTDTQEVVGFYERDFYVLSNFSSFQIEAHGLKFPTSEHLYHWTRFRFAETPQAAQMCQLILDAPSAHEAFQLAQANKSKQVTDWDGIKFIEMKKILVLKVQQHDYVKRKLLATGDRQLQEDSWRDDVWGIGPNGEGQNMLGKLWMSVRDEVLMYARKPTSLRDTISSETVVSHG